MKRRSLAAVILAAVASIALAGTAMAAAFSNGGFANTLGSYVDGGSGFMPNVTGTTIPGWTVSSGTAVDWIHTYWPAPYWPTYNDSSGTTSGYSVDMNASPTEGTLTQTFDSVVNSTYVVQFQLSGNPMCGAGDKTLTVSAGGSSENLTFTVPSAWANNRDGMVWQDDAISFVATNTSSTLTFESTTPNSNCGPALANVSVTETAANGAQCKNGGWASMLNPSTLAPFKNQGACVSFYATSGDVPIGS